MLFNCQHLFYSIDERHILRNVSLQLRAGESVALLGTNGAGKSTLLKLMLGILTPQSGKIELHNKPLNQWRRRDIAKHIAYVPQQHSPHFPYTVEQVIEQGCLPQAGLFRVITTEQKQLIEQAMIQMDVMSLRARNYTQLSGGERQRTLLARALVQQTPIILLDEPTNGLDYGSQLRLLMLLKEIAHSGRTILTITHNPEHALMFSDRVIALHQGEIIADGRPHQVIDTQLIHQLYGLSVNQLDFTEGRFFTPFYSQNNNTKDFL